MFLDSLLPHIFTLIVYFTCLRNICVMGRVIYRVLDSFLPHIFTLIVYFTCLRNICVMGRVIYRQLGWRHVNRDMKVYRLCFLLLYAAYYISNRQIFTNRYSLMIIIYSTKIYTRDRHI